MGLGLSLVGILIGKSKNLLVMIENVDPLL